MERALEIVDRRIREVLAASNQFKRDGKDADMFRCNTAFHWLDAVRRDIIEAIDKMQTNRSDVGTVRKHW